MRRIGNRSRPWLLVLGMLLGTSVGPARSQFERPPAADYTEKLERYVEARRAYETEAQAYWTAIAEKRRLRNAKRRNGEPIGLDDYVLIQPPVYAGPPRPVDPQAPVPAPPPMPPMPVVADFLRHAAEQFGFVPQRPPDEMAAKRAYVGAAKAAGLTKEQVVHVYAFETGGNGTYDVQAGLTSGRPDARAISPALGYNQLLSTNSVGLIAQHGDRYVAILQRKAAALSGAPKAAMTRKIEAFRRMVALSRSVPKTWSAHDDLAKTTPGGMGIHAVLLDRDLGPLLQAQKLLESVEFARRRSRQAPLTATELELMNFTGDGSGLDMVLMPLDLRQRVPTANFFQRVGYERNPIARRTGVVAALIAEIETKMERAARSRGAKDLAAAF
jgi:hypothetical protein